jgi:hypothetical protein
MTLRNHVAPSSLFDGLGPKPAIQSIAKLKSEVQAFSGKGKVLSLFLWNQSSPRVMCTISWFLPTFKPWTAQHKVKPPCRPKPRSGSVYLSHAPLQAGRTRVGFNDLLCHPFKPAAAFLQVPITFASLFAFSLAATEPCL